VTTESAPESTTGHRIEQARTQLGFSLSQLARRVGVKTKTLENWENDRSGPRVDRLVKLSGILQVPLIWMLTGDTPHSTDSLPVVSETANIAQKLERAMAMQQELAALLIDASADIARLQRELDECQETAAA
jgi:transcriptional regulator with XRE-family HTH domain